MSAEKQQHLLEKDAKTTPTQNPDAEFSAPSATFNATPMIQSERQQRSDSALREEVMQTTLQTESVDCDLIILKEKEGQESTLVSLSPSPPPSSPSHHPTTSPTSSKTSRQIDTAPKPSQLQIDTAPTTTTADEDGSETSRFHNEMSTLSSEMAHAVAEPIQTAGQDEKGKENEKKKKKAPAGTMIAREARRVENWMRKTGLGGGDDMGEGVDGVWEGDGDDADNDNDNDRADENEEPNSDKETPEMTLARSLQDRRGPRSENSRESVDSEFQRALRAFMGKGREGEHGLGQGRGLDSVSREGSSAGVESEYQGEIREMLGLEKVDGGKRKGKARSV